jgi:hypothetical protein
MQIHVGQWKHIGSLVLCRPVATISSNTDPPASTCTSQLRQRFAMMAVLHQSPAIRPCTWNSGMTSSERSAGVSSYVRTMLSRLAARLP